MGHGDTDTGAAEMDFRTQYFNNITVASETEYQALCMQAEIPVRTVKEIAEHQYVLTYAQFDATEWATMTREEHCRQVIDEAYLLHLLKLAKARKRAPKPVELVRCDCGHSVPRIQVMNASMGSACPDCYDRMSN